MGVRRAERSPERVLLLYYPLPVSVTGCYCFGWNSELAALPPGRRIQHPEGPALGKNHLAAGRQLRDVVHDVVRVEWMTPQAQAVVRVEDCQCIQ
ncbi:MAG: hypothetical protein ACYS19_00445 [Planctomycetota bacterium]